MNTTLSTFNRSFRAEIIKIRRTPILYIALTGGLFVCGLLFLLHLFNSKEFIKADVDPWIRYFDGGFMFTTTMLLVPYVVLVMSSLTFFEHQSSTWKYLYSLPFSKAYVYFSKLLLALSLLISTYIFFLLFIWVSAFLLDWVHPEYNFRNYAPDLGNWINRVAHSFITILGVAGLHYWISIRWKNFIIPIGIGLLGFIVATICIVSGKLAYAEWTLYAYPGLIGADIGITGQTANLQKNGWFYKFELISLACFAIFTTLGYLEEKWRNVK